MPRVVRFCAWLAIGACGSAVFAQSETAAEVFKRYPLRHKAAADVSRMLAELLGKEAELVVDARGNQILVRGTDQSQRVAQRLIAAIDEPAQSPDHESTPIETDLPETQERFLALSSWRAEQIEPALRKIFGTRCKRQPSRHGDVDWTVADDAGEHVTLRVDESRRGLAIVGSEPLASQVARLIQAHDPSRKSSAGAVRTVSLRKADPQKVQKAVEAYRQGNPSPSGASAKAPAMSVRPPATRCRVG